MAQRNAGGRYDEYVNLIHVGESTYIVYDMNNRIQEMDVGDLRDLVPLRKPPRNLGPRNGPAGDDLPWMLNRQRMDCEEDYEEVRWVVRTEGE